jgi:hypothetical protein
MLSHGGQLRLILAGKPFRIRRPPIPFDAWGAEYALSNKLQALVWAHKMSHSQQTIMLALADSGHDDGTNIYPSFGYLSWKTEYSIRQVMRIVKELRKLGAVKRIVRGNSHKRANEYRLDFSAFTAKEPWKRTSDKMSLVTSCHTSPASPTSDISGSTSDTAMSHQSPSESPVKHKKRARKNPDGSRASELDKKRKKIRERIHDLRLVSYGRNPKVIADGVGCSIEEVQRELDDMPPSH